MIGRQVQDVELNFKSLKRIRASSQSSSEDDCLQESKDIVEDQPQLSYRDNRPKNLKVSCDIVSVHNASVETKFSSSISQSINIKFSGFDELNKAAFDHEFDMAELEAAFASQTLEESKERSAKREKHQRQEKKYDDVEKLFQELEDGLDDIPEDMDYYYMEQTEQSSPMLDDTVQLQHQQSFITPVTRLPRWDEECFVNAPCRPQEGSTVVSVPSACVQKSKRSPSWNFSPLRLEN